MLPKGSPNKENHYVNTNCFRIKVLTKDALPAVLAHQTTSDVKGVQLKNALTSSLNTNCFPNRTGKSHQRARLLVTKGNFLLRVSSWWPGLSPPERLAG